MNVFGGLEDNAPDGSLGPAWGTEPNEWEHSASSDLETAAPKTLSPSPAPNAVGSTSAVADAANGPATLSGDSKLAEKRRRQRMHVRVTKIEPTKTDLIVWFDVHTSLPRFRSHYRDVRRTHAELRRFSTHLRNANPECFVPALPGPHSSFQSPEDQQVQLLLALQRWFDRVTRSALLTRDEEFLYFVEAVTGYVPTTRVSPPATGLARLVVKQRAPPPDENVELREFRPVAKLLCTYADELRAKLTRAAKTRRELAAGYRALAPRLARLPQSAPTTPNSSNAGSAGMRWDYVARATKTEADAELRRAELLTATLGDAMAVVAAEAFSIKETLTNRHLMMRDLRKAQSVTRERHQRANQLRGAADAAPGRVDEAITQLEAAAHLEKRITSTVRRVSDNLAAEKSVALARVETDVLDAIAAYTRHNIDQDRRVLGAWEQARPEVRAADPHGGLGARENAPNPHKPRSQRRKGDDWSDREQRARDFAPVVSVHADPLDRRAAVELLGAEGLP